jgi:hypothetical protein
MNARPCGIQCAPVGRGPSRSDNVSLRKRRLPRTAVPEISAIAHSIRVVRLNLRGAQLWLGVSSDVAELRQHDP